MKIGVDAMGGDNAPNDIIEGVILALAEGLDTDIVLYGDDTILQRQFLSKKNIPDRISIIHCEDNISVEEKPVLAVRRKKDSPIAKGCNDLKTGKIDAFVSAGSTGALLAGGTLITGRIKGIKRPALTTVFPTQKGFSILSDVGANAECTAKNIHQFGVMASLYSKSVLNINNPKLALMNIGSEETKGTGVYIEAHRLMKEDKSLNFIGNLESRDMISGVADVIVCDGFTGNIALKLLEGVSSSLFAMIKDILLSSFKSKIGAFLIKDDLKEFKKTMSASKYGGAPLLGTKKPIVKAHGSSDSEAVKNAVIYAYKYAMSSLIKDLESWVVENYKDQENNEKEESEKEI